SGLEHGLDLELDGHLVADDDAAALDGGVPADAEVAPADLRSGGEAGPGAAVGVGPEPVQLQRQRDVPGHALEGELAVHDVVVAVPAHAGRAVGHRGVVLDVEEVGRPDVRVALLLAGHDRVQRDLGGHRGAQRVRAGDDLTGEGGEPPPDLADHHVPDGEADLRVHRVDRPGARGIARYGGPGFGIGHDSPSP